MALNGNLSTMAAADLLQWIAQTRGTGTLEVERGQVVKRLRFQDGRVTGCSSNESSSRLGQALLSRGLIDEKHLRQALERQQATGENIGRILIELGAIDQEDLVRALNGKAEETIFGLFDWQDAVFRFNDRLPDDPYLIEVDLDVQNVILNGLQRLDETSRFRELFPDGNVVLARTATPVPAGIADKKMPSRILESINGQRTLAEIMLHARSSEFLVTKFLYHLHRLNVIEIVAGRTTETMEETSGGGAGTAVAEPTPAKPHPSSGQDSPGTRAADEPRPADRPLIDVGEDTDIEFFDPDDGDGPAPESTKPVRSQAPRTAEAEEPPASRATPSAPPARREGDLSAELSVAERLLESGEPEAALNLLQAVYRAHPGETLLRELIGRAERELEMAHRETFAPDRVPALCCSQERIRELGLSPEASFLPSLIDGETDIRSILWLAPMSTVDVLRTLKQMLDRGLIELTDPGERSATG